MNAPASPLTASPLDWLYPPICMACKNPIPLHEKHWRKLRLCGLCQGLLIPVPSPACPRCGGVLETDTNSCPSCYGRKFLFARNTAAFLYEGILRDILHDIKYRGRKQAALGLSNLWAESLTENLQADVIAPVPIHPKKLRARGFNQAEVLARALSATLKIPMEKNFLRRVADTPPQSGLSARAREENVRGVFAIGKNFDANGKEIIIVDDIFTTGISLNECASVLLTGGAKNVYGMTLAITVKN